jgi:hypothetical protein
MKRQSQSFKTTPKNFPLTLQNWFQLPENFQSSTISQCFHLKDSSYKKGAVPKAFTKKNLIKASLNFQKLLRLPLKIKECTVTEGAHFACVIKKGG